MISFRPLATWPTSFSKSRRNSTFRADYSATLTLLESELDAIHARTRVVQLAIDAGDVRRDGFPRASARPFHPGVIVSFDLMVNDQLEGKSFPCDTFLDWQDNLRGIALSLEALRKIERYGVTRNNQQYIGFPALPASGAAPVVTPEWRDAIQAAKFLVERADVNTSVVHVLQDANSRQRVTRLAKARCHPDAPTGSNDLFLRVQSAIEHLEKNAPL